MASSSDIRAGRAFVELYLQDTKFTRGLAMAEKHLKAWGGVISSIGTKITAATAALAVPALGAVNAFGAVQSEMAKLRAAVNPTADEMDRIRKAVNDISKATGTGPKEVAGAFTELLKAGTDVETALGGAAETVVKFAKVAEMDVASAATLVSDALHIFGKEGLNAAQIVDILAQSADASSIGINDVSQSFAMASAVAGAAGIKLKDLAAAIGILGNMGLKGSDAGTALKTMLLALAAPSDTAAAAMAKYGIETRDAHGQLKDFRGIVTELTSKLGNLDAASRDAALKDIFGTDAIRPALILMQQGVKGWDDFVNGMGSALGVGAKFSIIMDTVEGSIQKMWAAVQRAAATIGEALSGVFTQFAQWIEDTAGRIGAWAAANQEAIVSMVKTVAQVAAVGAALTVTGSIMTSTTAIINGVTIAVKGLQVAVTFLSANPLVALGAAVGIVAAKMISWDQVLSAVTGKLGRMLPDLSSFTAITAKSVDAIRAEHQAMTMKAKRLEELQAKQKLTNAEQIEAAGLAADLANAYPGLTDAIRDLGKSADATAKVMQTLNEALAANTAEAMQGQIADLEKRLKELKNVRDALSQSGGREGLEARRAKAQQRLGVIEGASRPLVGGDIVASSPEYQAEIKAAQAAVAEVEAMLEASKAYGDSADAIGKEISETEKRIAAIKESIGKVIAAGKAGPAEGPVAGAPKSGVPTALEDAMGRAGDDARISTIKSDSEREWQQILAKYAEEMKKATTPEERAAVHRALDSELAAATQRRIDAINEQARQAVEGAMLAQIDNEHEREIAEIRARYAKQIEDAATAEEEDALEDAMGKEIDAANEVYGKRTADRNMEQAEINERLRIQKNLQGREQQLALIELDRQKALREAAKTGADVGLINEQFNLQQQIANRSATSDVFGQQSGGTFSAQAAALMGQGTAAERTAKSTEETARNTKQMLAKIAANNWIGV